MDCVRGGLVVAMVAFHLCFDLVHIANIPLPWFSGALVAVWRDVVAWSFLAVAGAMCAVSRGNLARSMRYLGVALLVWAATSLTDLTTPVSFGIVFCMGACTLCEWLLERGGAAPRGPAAAAILFACFLLVRGVPQGVVGLPGLELTLPRAPYEAGWLAWLGFPGPGFASGDYYPLLPHLLVFLAGTALGRWFAERGWPEAVRERGCRPLELVGRHALVVYVLHQPLIVAVLWLLGLVP